MTSRSSNNETRHQLDFVDGRRLALMIARTYPCGFISKASIGTTWSPRDENGRHWSERRCHTALESLVTFDLVTVYDGFTGAMVRTNEAGYRYFNISGQPAYSDVQAERYFSHMGEHP